MKTNRVTALVVSVAVLGITFLGLQDMMVPVSAQESGKSTQANQKGIPAEKNILSGHTEVVWSVALSSDNKTALSGGEDKTIRVWDIGTGKQSKVVENLENGVRSVAYSSDGSRFYSVLIGGTVIYWDAASAKETGRLKGDTKGMRMVACSPDDTKLILGGINPKDGKGRLGVWDAKTGEVIL